MTTIRITQDVKNTLNKAAEAMFFKREEEADRPFMDMQELGKLVVETWLTQSGFAYHWQSIPAEHLFRSPDVKVKSLNGWLVGPGPHIIRLDDPVPQSPSVLAWRDSGNFGYALRDPVFEPIVKAWMEQQEVRRILTAEKQVFKGKVDSFLKRHATLKSALGEWPQLWELVPAEMRATHNEVKERQAKATGTAEKFDTSDMTGAIVATKMVNSIIG